MYIYQVYKTKKDLNADLKNNKLHRDYYFAYNKLIYQMIDDRNYIKVNYFEFENDCMRKRIEGLTNLEYQEGDIMKICNTPKNRSDNNEEIKYARTLQRKDC